MTTKLLILTLIGLTPALAADVTPIPVTADSYPFGAANHSLQSLDLAKAGYVEEEFLVRGTADVYDWAADGTVSVKTPNAPYADRILLRRPANPARFSGTVVVELMNSARRFDWAMMWGYSQEYFMEHGDAWVGISMPGAIPALQKFNQVRYSALSFKSPTPDGACAAVEDGLRWDMFTQVAAALKSGKAGGPMAGFPVSRIFMTTQSGDTVTYINAIQPRSTLSDGKPAYDGFLLKNAAAAARISQCGPARAKTAPGQMLSDSSVPVINVVAQGEVVANLASRRPDSDAATDRFRLYEIAGAAHVDGNPYRSLPSFPDQIAAVGTAQGTPDWPFAAKCSPEIQLNSNSLMKFSYDAAFDNLEQWVKNQTAPPKADRMALKDGALELDQFGNGVGGIRNPFVDVPVATYLTTSPGPGTCAELGHSIAFDPARVDSLYGSKKSYAKKVSESVDQMVKARYLTASDGKKLKAELIAAGN